MKLSWKDPPVLNRCLNCKSWFTNYPVPERSAMELYTRGDGNKRWSHEDFERDKASKVVDFFRQVLKPSMSILDVGCNTGEFLDYAKQKGCDTFGLELSKTSSMTVNKKGHRCENSIEKLSQYKFDLITAFDLVEHLYHPKKFIADLVGYLKPQGRLVILTGNKNSVSAKVLKNNWWYCNYPEHVVFPDAYFFRKELNVEIIDQIPCFASKIRSERWGRRLIDALLNRNDLGLVHDHSLFVLSIPSQATK